MNKAKNNFIFKLKIPLVIYFLIITFAMIVFLMPHISFGQVGNPADFDPIPNTPYQPPIFQPEVEAVRPITGDVAVDPSPVDTTGQAHNVSADTNTTVGDSGSFGEIIYDFVVTAVGGIMGLFGSFFDYAVDNFIIGFGDKFKNSGIGFQINKSWGLVRDIFNLTFIFGLVYIGFQMILGSGNSAKSALAHLISAALLVNFSLYITKFVIDFSNLAAAEIFKAFSGRGIGTSFINMLGFSQVLNFNNEAGGSIAWMYIIGLLVMFVVMIYVFAAAAIMITIRFAVLNIYMVASPIMFLGWVFPSMADYSQKYWKGFLGQAFFAPALIFMLYLSYNVTRGYSGLTQASPGNLSNIFKPQTYSNAPAVFTFFVLTIVFILASLVIAKEMGARGSSVAIAGGIKASKYVLKKTGDITAGGVAKIGRTVIGGGADRIRRSEAMKNFNVNHPFTAKLAHSALTQVTDNSFDVRNAFGGIGGALGIGTGKKGGFDTRQKERAKRYQEYLNTLPKEEKEKAEKEARETERVKKALENAENAKAETETRKTELSTAQNELHKKTADSRKRIIELNEILKSVTDKEEKKEMVNEINALEAGVKVEEKEAEPLIAELTKLVNDATKTGETVLNKYNDILKEETTKIIYASQLAYIGALGKWSDKLARSHNAPAAGIGATTEAIAAAGIGATTGAIAATVAGSIGVTLGLGVLGPVGAVLLGGASGLGNLHSNKLLVEALEKEYGESGMNKEKANKRKERALDIAKELKEAEVPNIVPPTPTNGKT